MNATFLSQLSQVTIVCDEHNNKASKSRDRTRPTAQVVVDQTTWQPKGRMPNFVGIQKLALQELKNQLTN